ncbi:MAG: hypothetical protein IT467_07335 [Dokdonella sp.]|nr:hypothetical protein [Dokdonella sp.]MBZ0221656.1 hypothetical protein [Dokdonella sp.]MCC7255730.1 hypothetical protein [Dokdonella sp.]
MRHERGALGYLAGMRTDAFDAPGNEGSSVDTRRVIEDVECGARRVE